MMIYGWTTYSFIRRLPSWLYYLKFQEILSNYSYAAIINFLEALLFMGGILVINFLLPRRLFLDLFVARGSLFAVLGVAKEGKGGTAYETIRVRGSPRT